MTDFATALTTKEAAAYLRVGLTKMYQLKDMGVIPHFQHPSYNGAKTGGKILFLKVDLDAYQAAIRKGGK